MGRTAGRRKRSDGPLGCQRVRPPVRDYVAAVAGDLEEATSIAIHGVDVHATPGGPGEHNLCAVRRPAGVAAVDRAQIRKGTAAPWDRELVQAAAVRVHGPDRTTVAGGGLGGEQDCVPARRPADRALVALRFL